MSTDLAVVRITHPTGHAPENWDWSERMGGDATITAKHCRGVSYPDHEATTLRLACTFDDTTTDPPADWSWPHALTYDEADAGLTIELRSVTPDPDRVRAPARAGITPDDGRGDSERRWWHYNPQAHR